MAGLKRRNTEVSRKKEIYTDRIAKDKIIVNKKRKISPQPISPTARLKTLADSSTADDSDSDGDGGVNLSSSGEEAALFGPSAQERGEAESDSDPIVESDTTEHSGEDDGVSWPSDDDSNLKQPSTHTLPRRPKAGENKTSLNASLANDSLAAKAASKDAASSSRESHVKQKAVAQERKAAKPNAESIARTKKLWERLRRKSHVPRDERKGLIAELFAIIAGNIRDFVFKHDSVRVVQTALKYADINQRRMIATELNGEYRNLAESRYAKFLVGKLLVHGDETIRDLVVPEFYGHVRRMIKHPEASWILDDIYRGAATPTQKAVLLREWYGAEFAIFRTHEKDAITADLADILMQQPEKKKPIMKALFDLINQCIQKKTTGFTMLHDAMLQYYLNVPKGSAEAVEFLELLKGDEEGDLLKNLAFTKSGSRIACLALAYGSAKDRKLLLRAYKDTIQALAYDLHGHQVLLAAYDVIDDTVLIAKSVFSELIGKDHRSEASQQNVLSAACNGNARIPLLYPFTGQLKSLPMDEQKLLNEIHAIRIETSKKDPEVRRKELIASLSPPLLFFIEKNVLNLMSSNLGCQFMSEVLLGALGDRQPALSSIANLASDNPGTDSGLHSSDFGRMLKLLVQGGRFNQKTKTMELSEPPLKFGDILYPEIKDNIIDWATSGNSFVILALTEATGFSFMEELYRTLGKGRPQIVNAADAGNRGSHLILNRLN